MQPADRNAVPKKTPKKSGFRTTTFIRCIAAMPWLDGSWAKAFITNVEKAKNTPPTVAAPMHEISAKVVSIRSASMPPNVNWLTY